MLTSFFDGGNVEIIACLEVEPEWEAWCNDGCCGVYHYRLSEGNLAVHLKIEATLYEVALELQLEGVMVINLAMQHASHIERHFDSVTNVDELVFKGPVDPEIHSNLPEGFILRRRPHLQVILGARGLSATSKE